MSSSSVFVSCADYDDDINANKAEIVAAQNEIAKLSSSLSALETELKTTKTNLESQLSTLESTFKTQIADAEGRLNAAIAAKADQTTVDNLIKEVNDLKTAYEANKAAVQAKIDAIDKDIATLQALIATKADQSALDAAIQTLTAAINGKVDKETYNEAVARISALETLLNSLKSDIETLRADKAALADVNSKVELINKDIAALQEALKDKVSTEAFNSLKATVEGLQTTLANVQAAFQAALDKKADQATVDALKADVQSKIDALNDQLKNYVTNDTFNAAVSRLETLIAALENSKADKTEVAALQATLLTVQAAVADLQNNKADKEAVQQALESLRKEVEALVASKADQTEIVRLDNLIEKLQALVDTKASQADVDAKEAALQALIAALEANKADKSELEAAKTSLENALKEAVDKLNEDIATKYAELNGRIDDVVADLADMRQDIVDILADLAAATGEIDRVEKKFDKLIADLQDADTNLDGKIDALDKDVNGKIAALEGIVNGHIEAYKIAKAALDQQVAALEAFQKNMEETVIPGLKEDLKNASDELKKKIKDEEDARKAAITEVMNLISDVKNDIAAKYSELKNYLADKEVEAKALYDGLDNRIKELEKQFSKIDQKIADAISANVENIMVYVSKVLKSISLVPQLYIGGIEAIEFNSLSYVPANPGTSGNPAIKAQGSNATHIKRSGAAITIDNGTAEAYYTLSPANVDRKTIDEENIVYKSAVAETRATTPYLGTETPVEFAGIAEWGVKGQAGLIKVNLKKTITGSLNLSQWPGYEGEAYIVNLNVPRKAQEVAGVEVDKENAVITSENHMLVENTFTPRIAHLHWGDKPGYWRGGPDKEMLTWFDPFAGAEVKFGYNVHHFTDSATMWRQHVDAHGVNDRSKLNMVLSLVDYNKTLDISKIVTACDIETPMDVEGFAGIDNPASGSYVENHAQSHQITVEKLKSFGLEFRYAIPTTPYCDPEVTTVDHSTNQQIFAEIDPITGIVRSKVPVDLADKDGYVYNNRACVGKEPIIRVMLIDFKNGGKLVDERYLKIKWVEPTKGTIELDPYENTTELIPCATNFSGGITWRHFIAKVYRVVDDLGMSQKTFENVYPLDKVTYGDVTMVWDDGSAASNLNLLSPAAVPGKPAAVNTTNLQGDALIADWTLEPQEIANIYAHQSKTFKCTIQFNSILPTEYPNIKFEWRWTITLPKFPVIVGYYNNYWLDPSVNTMHDVLPVQFNTAMYYAIKNGTVVPGKDYGIAAPAVGMQLYNKANNAVAPGVDYCVFYNNLMNAFTYDVAANKFQNDKNPKYILKDFIGECSTWDMQFTWKGVDFLDNNKSYPQAGGYRPASNTNSPSLNRINWKTAGAYKLETTAGKQALQMEWWGLVDEDGLPDQTDGEHVAWEPNIWPVKYNHAILYADHHNEANQALLNPLSQENESDGWTPVRTHNVNKAVHLGIWGTINDWNIAHVKDYDIYLVEPLRINASLKGAFEEGYVSGTAIRCEDAFIMRDFRGYDVARGNNGTTERTKYRNELYEYYEVEEPVWDLENVEYGMELKDGNITPVDTDKDVKEKSDVSSWMTAAQIKANTNGNIVLSIKQKTYLGVDYLVFKNNGGSNVETEVWISIPVWARYGFGKAQASCIVKLYPKGKVANGVTILPYPGGIDE